MKRPTPLPTINRRLFESPAQRTERRAHWAMYALIAVFAVGCAAARIFGA